MFLNTHTYYSLRYGTIAPKRLLELAKKLQIKALAITDINTTSACIDSIRLASAYDIKTIVGVDFRNGVQQEFVMLAKNNQGFQHINSYLSSFLEHPRFKIPERAKVLPNTYVIYPFTKGIGFPLAEHEYIGIRKEDLTKLPFSPWKHHTDKMVILQSISFADKKGFNTHRLLRAIANNMLLSKLPESEQGSMTDCLVNPKTLKEAFVAFPEIIKNTEHLLKKCTVAFDFSKNSSKNQKCYTSNVQLDYRLLRKLTYAGLAYRYAKQTKEILDRIEKELKMIQEKNFVSYFLINWKILKYARSKGYFYVGRGSGANSIVAYLLRITDVDPIELDLYFERFINAYRQNPPDFDIDFSWKDRDDVTRYIFTHFKHTALITVYNTFKYRAAIRELGKVFGLPKSEIDKLSLQQYNYATLDKLSQLVIIYSRYIEGFPNYLGVHAGGILISEAPIHSYTATFIPPKGYATTQFDMVVAEDVGLYKFDILSQRGLGKIKDAVAVIRYNRPEVTTLDIHDIQRFKQDERIKHLLKNAKAIGCFYVESPAMRMLLKKLQVEAYLDLVAASSVIRPGVSSSGMMREFILRFRYPEKRKEAHPVMLQIMPETYGVMVYQEDVIKVAHYFGGLTLGESDMLRRGMSGKFRSREEFLKVKDKFYQNCKASGKSIALTEEVWKQIESFAGYAFAKGHSASYAVESYQSLFLKAYYPLEYMVATINNFGGFYRTEIYVHEARRHGGIIKAPCINKSYRETVIYGTKIYIGFMFLHALETNTIQKLLQERKLHGQFASLDDFISRVAISLEQLSILIKINAFAFTKRDKRVLLWEAHMKISKVSIAIPNTPSLFSTPSVSYKTPTLNTSALEDAFDQIELLGYPLCSPFDLLVTQRFHPYTAKNIQQYKGKVITIEGYLVTIKKTRTSKGDRMFFATFLDRSGDFLDTVHFPKIAKRFPFRGKGIYALHGKVVEEFDCITLEIIRMERLAIIEDPRYTASRKAQRHRPKKAI